MTKFWRFETKSYGGEVHTGTIRMSDDCDETEVKRFIIEEYRKDVFDSYMIGQLKVKEVKPKIFLF